MVDLPIYFAAAATVIAAGFGSYISGRFGQRNAETETRRMRRYVLADAAIEAALSVRSALHVSDPEWTGRDWERVLGELYDALNAAAPVLPRKLQHLRRSIRAACGEALGGVAIFELVDIRETMEPAEFDVIWAANARDYVDVAIGALRHWRESKERDASSTSAPTFDDWLRFEGRYAPA